MHEMRKKSPASIQKWVNSIATDDDSNNSESDVRHLASDSKDKSVHDINELKKEEPSTSATSTNENLKGKFNEFYSKLNVNEKLKLKRQDFVKSLLAKTTQKLNKNKSTEELPEMEHETDAIVCNEKTVIDEEVEEVESVSEKNDESKEMDNLTVQRFHLGAIGRSSSENPNPVAPRNRRLNEIGRSFSLANDNEIPIEPDNSSNNLIYDADEDISITIPSLNASSSAISSNSQLDPNLSAKECSPISTLKRSSREHTVSEGHQSPQVQHKNPLLRDSSFQSDSSHCSSVESLLEARKPDAEAILINLGFGPVQGSDDILTKIPKRFLKPSQVRGVDTETFLKNQQLATNIHENSVLGYRGLLGNPHVEPSEIVKAIMDRFSVNEIQRMSSIENLNNCRPSKSFKGVANTIVLAHRQFMK